MSIELYSVMGVACFFMALFALPKNVLSCKKTCQQEAISKANDLFHLSKFSQVSPNFQRCHRKVLEAYSFLSGDKILCSLTVILRRASYFASMTIRVSSIDVCLYEKFCLSRRRRPIRLQKQTVGDYRIFSIFFAKAQLYFWS